MLRTTSVPSGKGTPEESNRNFKKYEDEVLKQCKGKSDLKSSNETEYNSDSGMRPKTEHTSSSAFENRDSSNRFVRQPDRYRFDDNSRFLDPPRRCIISDVNKHDEYDRKRQYTQILSRLS